MRRAAALSDDGVYRYWLSRDWADGPRAVFVMLNPSTADAEVDDPTIRRCMGFARREGCGGLVVVNLYALRTTRPVHLLKHHDPSGPDNAMHVGQVFDSARGPIVAAWGAWPSGPGRNLRSMLPLLSALRQMHCLGRTADGSPRHPLYVRADQPLEPYGKAAA